MVCSSWFMAVVSIPLLKGILAFFCAFLLIFGALFLFSPGTITKMNEWGNRVLFGPVQKVDRNVVLGFVLLVVGLIATVVLINL